MSGKNRAYLIIPLFTSCLGASPPAVLLYGGARFHSSCQIHQDHAGVRLRYGVISQAELILPVVEYPKQY